MLLFLSVGQYVIPKFLGYCVYYIGTCIENIVLILKERFIQQNHAT